MTGPLTLEEILNKAIQKEIEAQCLYLDLSQRMRNKTAKDAFQDLARQEQGHQHLLEQYQRGELKKGALRREQTVDYKIAEHFEASEISLDMEIKDIFLLAARREKVAHELYLSLAEIHPAGEVKKLIQELAAQELKHKQRLEFLYTEVAFPQTDGG